jgi:hypothetical protein
MEKLRGNKRQSLSSAFKSFFTKDVTVSANYLSYKEILKVSPSTIVTRTYL